MPSTKRTPVDGHADMPVRQSVKPANGLKPPPTTAAASVFAFGQAAKPARTRRPPIDVSAAVIRRGVPLPLARPVNGSRYAELWARMQVGDMVELPAQSAKALVSFAKKQPGAKAALRRTGEGADVYGVWRLA